MDGPLMSPQFFILFRSTIAKMSNTLSFNVDFFDPV